MPNHCLNIIDSISHDDPHIMKHLKKCLEQDDPTFLQTFVPCPEGVDAVSHWGTKWDIYDVYIVDATENSMSFEFSTAWAPPTIAYMRLKAMGFTIDAKFMEVGCDFCGYWHDGKETVFDNVRENLKNVPEEFHDYFREDNSEEEDENEKKDV